MTRSFSVPAVVDRSSSTAVLLPRRGNLIPRRWHFSLRARRRDGKIAGSFFACRAEGGREMVLALDTVLAISRASPRMGDSGGEPTGRIVGSRSSTPKKNGADEFKKANAPLRTLLPGRSYACNERLQRRVHGGTAFCARSFAVKVSFVTFSASCPGKERERGRRHSDIYHPAVRPGENVGEGRVRSLRS